MSNETGLTDQERAILATLAEKASADDPVLAAALRGGASQRRRLPAVPPVVLHWGVGLLVAVVGLALTVVSLSTSLVVGAVGLVLLVAGAGVVVADQARLRRARAAIAAEASSRLSD